MSSEHQDGATVVVLQELLAWTRAMAVPTVRCTIIDTLATVEERRVFELSDGERTTREIAEAAGVGNATVSRWWKRWRALGICIECGRGQSRHIASLDELGIPLVPPNES